MSITKKYRILFYLLIAILVNIVNIIRELENQSLRESLGFVPVVLVAMAIFLGIIYSIRMIISQLPIYLKSGVYTKVIINGIVIVCLSGIASLIGQEMARIFYDYSPGNVLFVGLFVSTICVAIYVYIVEAFFDSVLNKIDLEYKLSQIDKQKSIAKYQSLKKQLNPHFLFNSFNSLMGLIGKDQEKAEEFLHKLSDVYRYTLDHSEDIVVTLGDELKLLDAYLSLQKVRFGKNILCNVEVSDHEIVKSLPPMTVEILVENAIKHNAFSFENPLNIYIYTESGFLYVENSFNPMESDDEQISTGIGQKNLIDQYSLIHDVVPMFWKTEELFIAKIPLLKLDE